MNNILDMDHKNPYQTNDLKPHSEASNKIGLNKGSQNKIERRQDYEPSDETTKELLKRVDTSNKDIRSTLQELNLPPTRLTPEALKKDTLQNHQLNDRRHRVNSVYNQNVHGDVIPNNTGRQELQQAMQKRGDAVLKIMAHDSDYFAKEKPDKAMSGKGFKHMKEVQDTLKFEGGNKDLDSADKLDVLRQVASLAKEAHEASRKKDPKEFDGQERLDEINNKLISPIDKVELKKTAKNIYDSGLADNRSVIMDYLGRDDYSSQQNYKELEALPWTEQKKVVLAADVDIDFHKERSATLADLPTIKQEIVATNTVIHGIGDSLTKDSKSAGKLYNYVSKNSDGIANLGKDDQEQLGKFAKEWVTENSAQDNWKGDDTDAEIGAKLQKMAIAFKERNDLQIDHMSVARNHDAPAKENDAYSERAAMVEKSVMKDLGIEGKVSGEKENGRRDAIAAISNYAEAMRDGSFEDPRDDLGKFVRENLDNQNISAADIKNAGQRLNSVRGATNAALAEDKLIAYKSSEEREKAPAEMRALVDATTQRIEEKFSRAQETPTPDRSENAAYGNDKTEGAAEATSVKRTARTAGMNEEDSGRELTPPGVQRSETTVQQPVAQVIPPQPEAMDTGDDGDARQSPQGLPAVNPDLDSQRGSDGHSVA